MNKLFIQRKAGWIGQYIVIVTFSTLWALLFSNVYTYLRK